MQLNLILTYFFLALSWSTAHALEDPICGDQPPPKVSGKVSNHTNKKGFEKVSNRLRIQGNLYKRLVQLENPFFQFNEDALASNDFVDLLTSGRPLNISSARTKTESNLGESPPFDQGDLFKKVVKYRSLFLTEYLSLRQPHFANSNRDDLLVTQEDYVRLKIDNKPLTNAPVDPQLAFCTDRSTHRIPKEKIVVICDLEGLPKDVKQITQQLSDFRPISLTEYVLLQLADEFKKIVDFYSVGNTTGTLKEKWDRLSETRREQALTKFKNSVNIDSVVEVACGKDAQNNGAFADHTKNIFVICPATLWTESVEDVEYTIAHEISHVGDAINLNDKKVIKDIEEVQAPIKELAKCLQEIGEVESSHINESLADYWTGGVLIRELIHDGTVPHIGKSKLKTKLEFLCQFTSDNYHTSGPEIVNTMLVLNPTARSYFGNTGLVQAPYCHLSGRSGPAAAHSGFQKIRAIQKTEVAK